MSGLRLALGFLTRIPVGATTEPAADADAALARAVPWFGAVGAAVGALAAAVYAAARWALPAPAAATVAVATSLVLTGAFHEDGLADSADALWGGYDRDRRLAILKDSRHGTYGVAALTLALVLRITLLASLAPATAVGALVAAGALGRGVAIVLMATTEPARPEGLGASYVRALRPAGAVAGIGVAVALGTGGLAGWVALAAPAALAMAWIVRRVGVAKVGGIVGDLLGAAEQLGELAVLGVAATVVHRHAPPWGWWPR